MPTYVAFLRAINLGARRRFPKAAIVRAAEAAGCTEVETWINTGNVRVTTRLRSHASVEAALEAAFAEEAGFEVPTVALTQAELAAVAADAVRLGDGHDGAQYVSLLKEPAGAESARALEAVAPEGERVHVAGRAVHLLIGPEYHTARLTNAVVERHLGVATNRNVTVVRTLAERWT